MWIAPTTPDGAHGSAGCDLWLESDRMGHLLGAIDQAKLGEQRAIVKNEKRQGDNAPYAMASDLIMRAMMPVGHPYAHSVIGSMEDLDAATLEDVREWFRTYYGPSNAVLVLSNDITVAEAREQVQKYLGDFLGGRRNQVGAHTLPSGVKPHWEMWALAWVAQPHQCAEDTDRTWRFEAEHAKSHWLACGRYGCWLRHPQFKPS